MSTGERSDLSGWLRSIIADEPRLPELVELNEELGIEAMVLPAAVFELGEEWNECYLGEPERYHTINSRSLEEGGDTMEEAHHKQAADCVIGDDDTGCREKSS